MPGAGVDVGVGICDGMMGIGGPLGTVGDARSAGTLKFGAETFGTGTVMVGGKHYVCCTFAAFVQSLIGKVSLELVVYYRLFMQGGRRGTDV